MNPAREVSFQLHESNHILVVRLHSDTAQKSVSANLCFKSKWSIMRGRHWQSRRIRPVRSFFIT